MSKTGAFQISSGDSEFNDRQKQLLDHLCNAEKSFNKDKSVSYLNSQIFKLTPQNRKCRPANKHETKRFRGKESIFVKPDKVPVCRTRFRRPIQGVPDYHKNPSKWTKYSLADSPDVTQKSNSQAAFAFLNSLRNKDKQEPELEEMEADTNVKDSIYSKRNKETEKIVFKHKLPNIEGTSIEVEPEEKPVFRNSKLIMPECVVGEKPPRNRQKKVRQTADNNNKKKCIKLDHLNEEEEEM